MDVLPAHFLSGLFAIVLIDLVLAGDNAIVIALAARKLPHRLQTQAIFWGTFGAIVVRILMTTAVMYVMKIPGLSLAGALVLLPIAWKLLASADDDPHIEPAAGFWAAMRTIIIADALMGLDNVLAIAGAARDHLGLVVLGLLISVPLVVWGAQLILKLIERYPLLVYLGAAAIAWTSARMIAHEHFTRAWFRAHDWATYLLDVLLIALVCGLGYLSQQRQRSKRRRDS